MSKLEYLQKALDSEKWEPLAVSEEYTSLIEVMHNHGTIILDQKLFSAKMVAKITSDEIQYSPTNSLMVLIGIILQYVQLISAFPAISCDGALNLLETIKASLRLNFSVDV